MVRPLDNNNVCLCISWQLWNRPRVTTNMQINSKCWMVWSVIIKVFPDCVMLPWARIVVTKVFRSGSDCVSTTKKFLGSMPPDPPRQAGTKGPCLPLLLRPLTFHLLPIPLLQVCCKDWSASYTDLLERCQIPSLSLKYAEMLNFAKNMFGLADCTSLDQDTELQHTMEQPHACSFKTYLQKHPNFSIHSTHTPSPSGMSYHSLLTVYLLCHLSNVRWCKLFF